MNGYNFTEDLRRVLAAARGEAAGMRHEYVGTEHILLALAHDHCVAADVLQRLGVERDALRSTVMSVVKVGPAGARGDAENLPYTSRAKKVLELAMNEARQLTHSYVGTEHLLLGVIREEKGIAAQALASLGVKLSDARAEVLRHAGVRSRSTAAEPGDTTIGYGSFDAAPHVASVPTPPGATQRALYAAMTAAVIVMAVLHLVATFRLYPDLSPAAMSYVGTGLLLLLGGVLNAVNSARESRALSRLTIATNMALTVFVAVSGAVSGSGWLALSVVVGLFVVTTVLSATSAP